MPRLMTFFLCGASLDMLLRRCAPTDWLLEYAYQLMWLCIGYSLVVVFGLVCLCTARNRPVGAAVLASIGVLPLVLRWSRALGFPSGATQLLLAIPIVVTLWSAYRARGGMSRS